MGRHNWELIKREYIYGDSDGLRPTLEDLAVKHGCSPSYLREKAAKEKWLKQAHSAPSQDFREQLKADCLRQLGQHLHNAFEPFLAQILQDVEQKIEARYALSQPIRSKPKDTVKGFSPEHEWIYFVLDSDRGVVKIGISSRPIARLNQLQTGSSTRLKLVCLIPGSSALEAALHAKFARYRVGGEWFSVNGELESLIAVFSAN